MPKLPRPARSFAAHRLSWRLAAGIVASALMGNASARAAPVKPGQTVVLMPVNFQDLDVKPTAEARDVLVQFSDEGKPVEYGLPAEILVYAHKGDPRPLATYRSSELRAMHETTHCRPALKSLLAGSTGGLALFCNAAMDLTKGRYFVLRRPGHDDEGTAHVQLIYRDRRLNVLHAALVFDDDD